ncbi:recombinase family protein [Paenibacillaceae bacterium WGS1546]|uniref:recombinase family protein n=1 Tax=Cohnella sp. WGS1546 TaxID=3366810 RepID=UPI00372D1098
MRVATYSRVSTDEQVKEGYSLDAQLEKLSNYCKSQDWTIEETYVEEGKSAKDVNRPELQRMLADARSGKFEVILVYRLDRLTRSVMDLYELLNIFEESGVKFKSATEVYDTTTAMGKLFITIVAALAQWERENLSERVRFGMEELVREGRWHGGPVPYGYSWDGQRMTIIESEAKILRELRKIYMSGEGLGSTAKKLNNKELMKRGRSWSATSVWYVLDNPIYAGKIRYGEKKKNGKYASRKKEERVNVIWSDSGFPTIFSWDEYQEHTERMKRKEFYGHAKKREYRFTGVLRCARCNSTLIGRPYRNKNKDGVWMEPHYNYICSGRALSSGCDLPLLRQEVAEKMIMQHLDKIKLDHDEIMRHQESPDSNHDQELEKLKRELVVVRERRKKWQYLLADDLISKDDFRLRRKEEDERELEIKETIEEMKAKHVGASRNVLDKALGLSDIWPHLNDAERRELMQITFKRIVIDCEVKSGKGIAGRGKSLPFAIREVEFN